MKNKFKIKAKNKENLEVQIIESPFKNLKQERERVVFEMRDVTKRCWADFKDVTYKWFDLADVLILVRNNRKLVAFAADRFVKQGEAEERIIIALSSMVLPEYQNIGLSKRLQKITVKKFIRHNIKLSGWHFWKFFRKIFFAYRTANPRLIKAALRYNPALSISERKVTEAERRVGKIVAKLFSPNKKFNESEFIIENAFEDNPQLIYKKNNIPWSGDRKIDLFCEQMLGFKKKKGHLFVVVGHLSFIQQLLVLFTK